MLRCNQHSFTIFSQYIYHRALNEYFQLMMEITHHPRINFIIITTVLKKISGILVTVLIDLTKWRIWVFTVGCSPNPWTGAFAPQPILLRNLSSCKIQTAFKHKIAASNKFHRVKPISVIYRKTPNNVNSYRTMKWGTLHSMKNFESSMQPK